MANQVLTDEIIDQAEKIFSAARLPVIALCTRTYPLGGGEIRNGGTRDRKIPR